MHSSSCRAPLSLSAPGYTTAAECLQQYKGPYVACFAYDPNLTTWSAFFKLPGGGFRRVYGINSEDECKRYIGAKFIYQDRPGVLTFLCFHQASYLDKTDLSGHLRLPAGPGNTAISKYLAYLGYKQDMIEWATAADPQHRRCLNHKFNPELAKEFNIDFWYNTEDAGGRHYTLPGDHGLLPEQRANPLPPDMGEQSQLGVLPSQNQRLPQPGQQQGMMPPGRTGAKGSPCLAPPGWSCR